MRGDAGSGVGWGRMGMQEGVGGGIMTSIRRAHMRKLWEFTAFFADFAWVRHVPPLPSSFQAFDSPPLTFKGT